jgi:hypothetical protein
VCDGVDSDFADYFVEVFEVSFAGIPVLWIDCCADEFVLALSDVIYQSFVVL